MKSQTLLKLVPKQNQDGGGDCSITAKRSFSKIIEKLNRIEAPFAIIVVGSECKYMDDIFHRLILRVKVTRLTTRDKRPWQSEIRECLRAGQSVAIKLTDKESCNHAMRHAVVYELKELRAAKKIAIFFVNPPLKDVFAESVRDLRFSRLLYALRLKFDQPTADGVDYLIIV